MDTSAPKKTPLYDWHQRHGAVVMEFGGWLMPLWYKAGAIAEHRTVITAAGMFDTSHMSTLLVSGSVAYEVLQRCFTRDLAQCVGKDRSPLRPGVAVYGAFLNEEGHAIDDAVLYQLSSEEYLCIVNAGMGETVADHLCSHCDSDEFTAVDVSLDYGKIDLQGPDSGKILTKVIRDPDRLFSNMPYFTFKGLANRDEGESEVRLTDGTSVLLSRSGYTGEFGFELVIPSANVIHVWDRLIAAGEEFGLLPCGLAARDSLRTGAVLPLSHQDIGPWPFINHPWSIALPWDEERTGFTKSFVGDSILHMKDRVPHTLPFVGFDPRKVSLEDHPTVATHSGAQIGTVLTCVSDMAIARHDDRIFSMASPDKPVDFKPRGLCCGFVRLNQRLEPGRIVQLRDNRRSISVTIAEDIRPDRTARRPIRDMLCNKEKKRWRM